MQNSVLHIPYDVSSVPVYNGVCQAFILVFFRLVTIQSCLEAWVWVHMWEVCYMCLCATGEYLSSLSHCWCYSSFRCLSAFIVCVTSSWQINVLIYMNSNILRFLTPYANDYRFDVQTSW